MKDKINVAFVALSVISNSFKSSSKFIPRCISLGKWFTESLFGIGDYVEDMIASLSKLMIESKKSYLGGHSDVAVVGSLASKSKNMSYHFSKVDFIILCNFAVMEIDRSLAFYTKDSNGNVEKRQLQHLVQSIQHYCLASAYIQMKLLCAAEISEVGAELDSKIRDFEVLLVKVGGTSAIKFEGQQLTEELRILECQLSSARYWLRGLLNFFIFGIAGIPFAMLRSLQFEISAFDKCILQVSYVSQSLFADVFEYFLKYESVLKSSVKFFRPLKDIIGRINAFHCSTYVENILVDANSVTEAVKTTHSRIGVAQNGAMYLLNEFPAHVSSALVEVEKICKAKFDIENSDVIFKVVEGGIKRYSETLAQELLLMCSASMRYFIMKSVSELAPLSALDYKGGTEKLRSGAGINNLIKYEDEVCVLDLSQILLIDTINIELDTTDFKQTSPGSSFIELVTKLATNEGVSANDLLCSIQRIRSIGTAIFLGIGDASDSLDIVLRSPLSTKASTEILEQYVKFVSNAIHALFQPLNNDSVSTNLEEILEADNCFMKSLVRSMTNEMVDYIQSNDYEVIPTLSSEIVTNSISVRDEIENTRIERFEKETRVTEEQIRVIESSITPVPAGKLSTTDVYTYNMNKRDRELHDRLTEAKVADIMDSIRKMSSVTSWNASRSSFVDELIEAIKSAPCYDAFLSGIVENLQKTVQDSETVCTHLFIHLQDSVHITSKGNYESIELVQFSKNSNFYSTIRLESFNHNNLCLWKIPVESLHKSTNAMLRVRVYSALYRVVQENVVFEVPLAYNLDVAATTTTSMRIHDLYNYKPLSVTLTVKYKKDILLVKKGMHTRSAMNSANNPYNSVYKIRELLQFFSNHLKRKKQEVILVSNEKKLKVESLKKNLTFQQRQIETDRLNASGLPFNLTKLEKSLSDLTTKITASLNKWRGHLITVSTEVDQSIDSYVNDVLLTFNNFSTCLHESLTKLKEIVRDAQFRPRVEIINDRDPGSFAFTYPVEVNDSLGRLLTNLGQLRNIVMQLNVDRNLSALLYAIGCRATVITTESVYDQCNIDIKTTERIAREILSRKDSVKLSKSLDLLSGANTILERRSVRMRNVIASNRRATESHALSNLKDSFLPSEVFGAVDVHGAFDQMLKISKSGTVVAFESAFLTLDFGVLSSQIKSESRTLVINNCTSETVNISLQRSQLNFLQTEQSESVLTINPFPHVRIRKHNKTAIALLLNSNIPDGEHLFGLNITIMSHNNSSANTSCFITAKVRIESLRVKVDCSRVDFGKMLRNSQSQTRTVVLTNESSLACRLKLSIIGQSDYGSEKYNVALDNSSQGTANLFLEPHSSKEVTLRLTPSVVTVQPLFLCIAMGKDSQHLIPIDAQILEPCFRSELFDKGFCPTTMTGLPSCAIESKMLKSPLQFGHKDLESISLMPSALYYTSELLVSPLELRVSCLKGAALQNQEVTMSLAEDFHTQTNFSDKSYRFTAEMKTRKYEFPRPQCGWGTINCFGFGVRQRIPIGSAIWKNSIDLPFADIGSRSKVFMTVANYSCVPLPFQFNFADNRFSIVPAEGIVPVGRVSTLQIQFAGSRIESRNSTVLKGHIGYLQLSTIVNCAVFSFKVSVAASQRQVNIITLNSSQMIGTVKDHPFSVYISNKSQSAITFLSPLTNSVKFANGLESVVFPPTCDGNSWFSSDNPEKVDLLFHPSKIQINEEVKFQLPIQNGGHLECSYTVKINSPGMDIKLSQDLRQSCRVFDLGNITIGSVQEHEIFITNSDYLEFTVDYVAGISGTVDGSVIFEHWRDKLHTAIIPGRMEKFSLPHPKINALRPFWKLKFQAASIPSILFVFVTLNIRNSFHSSCNGDIVRERLESFVIFGNVVIDSIAKDANEISLLASPCGAVKPVPLKSIYIALQASNGGDSRLNSAGFTWALCSSVSSISSPSGSTDSAFFDSMASILQFDSTFGAISKLKDVLHDDLLTVQSLRNIYKGSNLVLFYLAEWILSDRNVSTSIVSVGAGILSLRLHTNLEAYSRQFMSSSSVDCWKNLCEIVLKRPNDLRFGDILEEVVGSLTKASILLSPVTESLRLLESGNYSNSQLVMNYVVACDKSSSGAAAAKDMDYHLLELLMSGAPTSKDINKFLLQRLGFETVIKELESLSYRKNVINLCVSLFADINENDQLKDECLCILRGMQCLSSQTGKVEGCGWFFAASANKDIFDGVLLKFRNSDTLFDRDSVDAVVILIDFLVREETNELSDIALQLKLLFRSQHPAELKARVDESCILDIFPTVSQSIPDSQLQESHRYLQYIVDMMNGAFYFNNLKYICDCIQRILLNLSPLSEVTKAEYNVVCMELTSRIMLLLRHLRSWSSFSEFFTSFTTIMKYSRIKSMVSLINSKLSTVVSAVVYQGATEGLNFLDGLKDCFPKCLWLQHLFKTLNGLFLEVESTQTPLAVIRFGEELCILKASFKSETIDTAMHRGLVHWLTDIAEHPNQPTVWLDSYCRWNLLDSESSIRVLFNALGQPQKHDIHSAIDTLMLLYDRKSFYGSFSKRFDVALSFFFTILRTRQLSLCAQSDKSLWKGLFLSLLGLIQLETLDLLDHAKASNKIETGGFPIAADTVESFDSADSIADVSFDAAEEKTSVAMVIEATRIESLRVQEVFMIPSEFAVNVLGGVESLNVDTLLDKVSQCISGLQGSLIQAHEELKVTVIINNSKTNPLRGKDILDGIMTVTAAGSLWRSAFFPLCRISKLGWFEGSNSEKASKAFTFLVLGKCLVPH